MQCNRPTRRSTHLPAAYRYTQKPQDIRSCTSGAHFLLTLCAAHIRALPPATKASAMGGRPSHHFVHSSSVSVHFPSPQPSFSAVTALAYMPALRRLFNDWYEPDRNLQGYHNELAIWCSRIGIPGVKFELNKVYCVEGGRRVQKWEAIPIFPRVYARPFPLGNRDQYTGRGGTKPEAQDHSLQLIEYLRPGYDTTYIRWEFFNNDGYSYARPYEYGGPEPLDVLEIIGLGVSQQAAKEDSSRKLLCLRRYCAYTHS